MPVSGIATEGLLPDVDSRAPATAGEERVKENWLGEGDRVGEVSTEGQTGLRLCNLVAQSSRVAEGGVSEGRGARTHRKNNRALGNCLLQTLPEPDAGHRARDRDRIADAGLR